MSATMQQEPQSGASAMARFREKVAQFEFHAAKLVEVDSKVKQYSDWSELIKQEVSSIASGKAPEVSFVVAPSIPQVSFKPATTVQPGRENSALEDESSPSCMWAVSSSAEAKTMLEKRRREYARRIANLQEEAGRHAKAMEQLNSQISARELHNSLVEQYKDVI
eukprot:gb/GECG01014017.1/.p1 GENE.gb/GECG01014017.1/~~gb/GECG01014017.1/.p1  ORF type:complete len:165 (+),score=28.31 gb/GECG01014017.1/:1-495(+)